MKDIALAKDQDGAEAERKLNRELLAQGSEVIQPFFATLNKLRSDIEAKTKGVDVVHPWGHLVHYPLSAREMSCFCRVCGTPLLTYFIDPEPMNGMAQISAGALDTTEGLRLAADICTDEKPDFYAFEGERRDISSAAVANMFGKPQG